MLDALPIQLEKKNLGPWATESEITTFRDCRNTKKRSHRQNGKTMRSQNLMVQHGAISDPKV